NIEGGATTPVSSLDTPYASAPQVVKDMVAAIGMGPTGYSNAMRSNLHMDESIAGQDANGVRPVSKMTMQSAMPDGYTAHTPSPDPRGAGTPGAVAPHSSQADRDLAGAAAAPAPAPAPADSGGG